MLTIEGLIAVISLVLTAFGLGYAIGNKDIVNEKNACVLLRLQRRIHAAKQHTSYVYPCASIIVNACILCVYYNHKTQK